MEVVPLTDFQHGRKAFRQDVVEDIPESMANDLERAGLVRVKMTAPPRRTQEAPPRRTQDAPPAERRDVPDPGKAPAGGEGTPSASSPAARVSPATTAEPPKRGRGRPRKTGT